ncbi:MAG: prolyl oligopeptidase family protein [Fidelibacterota bacterium]
MMERHKSHPECSQLSLQRLFITALFLFTACATPTPSVLPQRVPQSERDNVTEILHGVEIVDPYRWLEDQQSPETRAWIDAQNAYAHSFIDPLPGRETLKQRLSELMRIDRIGIPTARNGRYFLYKRSAAQEQWVIYVREGLDGEDEVLIDPHPMSPDHTTSVTLLDISKDGTTVAYGVRRGGEDEVTVKFLDVDSRTHLTDELPKGRYFGVSMLADKSGFYYSRHTEEGSRVYFHAMGSDPAGDAEIFGEGYGSEQGIAAGVSEDGTYLILTVFHGSAAKKVEIYVQDLVAKGPIVPIVNDIDARFTGDVADNTLFMQTNWEAPNGRILAVDLANPGREHWKEIIPARQDAVIEGFSLAGGKIFVNTLENVVSRVTVFDTGGNAIRDISFPTLGTVGGIHGRWDSDEAFFIFTSFHVPTTIYRYEISTGEKDVWARLDVPVDTEIFDVRQVWYTSKDQTRIPMFLVHRKGIQLDGSHPTLLTGYGGFTISLTPYFSSTAVLWVENGGVFAMPNLRGGGEFGEAWHQAGMLQNKQNVFDDFIAAAEWLVEHGYTRPSRLAIAGGSNGGLLVGAAMTQRPDLFRAVVCSYPLLDMIRYHRFLVAKLWVSEYGSADDPEQFEYIRAYSPYHNVRPGVNYPAVLFITGDADTRVDPLHARKMTALMQSETGSDNPILLLYDTKSGHSGGRPVSKQIEDETDKMSFLFWQLGMLEALQSVSP